jgi:hypothetical protein
VQLGPQLVKFLSDSELRWSYAQIIFLAGFTSQGVWTRMLQWLDGASSLFDELKNLTNLETYGSVPTATVVSKWRYIIHFFAIFFDSVTVASGFEPRPHYCTLRGNPNWRWRMSTVDLLVLTCLNHLIFKVKLLLTLLTKPATLMGRSTVHWAFPFSQCSLLGLFWLISCIVFFPQTYNL